MIVRFSITSNSLSLSNWSLDFACIREGTVRENTLLGLKSTSKLPTIEMPSALLVSPGILGSAGFFSKPFNIKAYEIITT